MEEHLTILEKLSDKNVTLIKKYTKFMWPAGTKTLSVGFE